MPPVVSSSGTSSSFAASTTTISSNFEEQISDNMRPVVSSSGTSSSFATSTTCLMSSSSTTSVKCSVAPLQPQAPLQPLDSSSNNMDPLIGGPATGDLSFELTQQHQGN